MNPLSGTRVHDWKSETTEEVTDGVFRIPLPMPNDGLAAVNTYLLIDPAGPVLIDPGWAVPEARAALERGLDRVGVDVRDVRRTLATHVHRDHYTMAVELQRLHGIGAALGLAERRSLDLAMASGADVIAETRDLLCRHGAGPLAEEVERDTDNGPGGHYEYPDSWLSGGDEITLEARRLSVLATPGHTAGHLVFHDAAHNLLFAGDHVLPTITPSVGFEPALRPSPLTDFLDSLQTMLALPDAVLLPAHGAAGGGLHDRTLELIEHHERRLEVMLSVVRLAEADAASVAAQVPWTRQLRRLDQLTPFNRMLAVLETVHHLVLLAERGLIASRIRGERLLFRAAA